jgi:hypothetical protein
MVINNIQHLKYLSLELLSMDKLMSVASKRVKTVQVFESGNVFHRDGLFSNDIFGDVGSADRFRRNGHIDLKINILHPLVYIGLTTLSSLYEGILTGTMKAVYNPEIKNFVADPDGSTGYEFFMSHYQELDIPNPSSSDLREFKIALGTIPNRDILEMNVMGVVCAGVRDYVVDRSGAPSQGEINDLYRSLINIANMIPDNYISKEYNMFIESIRSKLQKKAVDIYLMQLDLLLGKRGLIQSHLVSKTIKYGTRNVITADSSRIDRIGGKEHLRFNEITVGIFQHAKAITPIAVSYLKRIFLNIFSPDERTATVIDNKTFKNEKVEISIKTVQDYTSSEGIRNYLNKFNDPDFSKMMFGGDTYSFAMVYEKDGVIEIVSDTSYLDESEYKYLRPITNIELLYIAILPILDKYYASTTRYPAINQGSTFICIPKIKPTISLKKAKVRVNGMEIEVVNYPIPESGIFDAMSPNHSRLARSVADFDGDRV